MSNDTAAALFVMVLFGALLDFCGFRMLIVLGIAFYWYRKGKRLGYQYMKIEREKDYNN
jgi:hypothetical protein